MNYANTERELNKLHRKDRMMFRMAISHLMDVGIRHLTEENIAHACEQIMQEDDTNYFMTNAYRCDLLRMAGKLAKIDHTHLLVYISRHLNYDVGDDAPDYSRLVEVIQNLIGHIEYEHDKPFVLSILHESNIWESDLKFIGCEHLIEEDEEETP